MTSDARRWTPPMLLRLDLALAARALADDARRLTHTFADEDRGDAQLVADAEDLVDSAEWILLLAVAATAARTRTPWTSIAAATGRSKQAVQQRFAQHIPRVTLQALVRPDGDDPDQDLAELEAWAQRHVDPKDADAIRRHRGDLVESGLRARYDPARDNGEAIEQVLGLEALIAEERDREIEPGEHPDSAVHPEMNNRLVVALRRASLESAFYDARTTEADADRLRPERDRRDARRRANEAWNELVALWTTDALSRLSWEWQDDEHATIKYDNKPLLIVSREEDPVGHDDEYPDGWWAERASAELTLLEDAPDVLVEGLQHGREQVEALALQEVASTIGSDRAKGYGPFDPGGIAGPSTEDLSA